MNYSNLNCRTCGKKLPEFAKIIGKRYCSQECENRDWDSNKDWEDLFNSFFWWGFKN